jgi:hypothetical protein
LTGIDETAWEFKRTAEAGLVNTGKRITRKIRTITDVAKRFCNSVIGYKMDRFSNIGGQVGELAIRALITEPEPLVNLIGLSSEILIMAKIATGSSPDS